MIRRVINIETATDGSATAYGGAAVGVLYAVQKVDGDLADGVDLTLTCEEENLSIPLLVEADFNSDGMAYPRVLEALNTDGTALSTHCMPVVFGRPKAVIANGGSVKTGAIVLYIVEV
jgi:hypothetical protein